MSERDRDGVDRDALIEAVVSPWRDRDPDGLPRAHPAWADLAPGDRVAAYERTVASRLLESAFDPRGLSATGHAVLARARRTGQLGRE